MTITPLRNRNAPALRADAAFREFCSPSQSKYRHPDYRRLAQRARFHLRHARQERLPSPGGELQIYIFDPAGDSKGVILLIHGWAAEGSFMSAFAEPLRRMGYQIVVFDLPAHGRSEGTRTNLAACARAAHRVAEQWSPIKGIVSHSFGGLVALWIAEGGPPLPSAVPVEKLALLACPDRLIDVTREFGADRELEPKAQLGFETRIERIGHRPVSGFSATTLLKRIESPVMLAHSADDNDVVFSNAQTIAANHPRVRLSAYEGLGHAGLLFDTAVIRSAMTFIGQA